MDGLLIPFRAEAFRGSWLEAVSPLAAVFVILTLPGGGYNGRSQEMETIVQKHRSKSRFEQRREAPPIARAPARRRLRLAAVAVGLAAAAMVLAFFFQLRMRKNSPPVLQCEVIASYPHAADAFTQGLVLEDGVLYEGTGGLGASTLRKVTPATGEVVQRIDLDPRHFGEGIAIVGDEIYQLTWRSQVGFVYDKHTFQKLREFRYKGEGWGLTYDGKHLILSDGSDVLRFFDPRTFREARRLHVTSAGRGLHQLNELEYADGFVYANLWHSDYLVKISPQSGEVVAWIDARGLWPSRLRDREAVLNGIAHDPTTNRFFLTGKNWPTLFEVQFVEPASRAPR
jgi:glutamine cyclotransferase